MSFALSCLVVALLASSSSAQWNTGIAITSMEAGSEVLYLTVSSKNSVLLQGAQPNPNATKGSPPPPAQSWTTEGLWPYATFSLLHPKSGLYLDSSNGVSLKSKSGTAAQMWHYDEFGHLVSADGQYLSSAFDKQGLYTTNLGKLVLSYATTKLAQRWAFLPTKDAPVLFKGYISFLSPTSDTLLCIDSGVELVPGANNPPVLRECSADKPGQLIHVLPTYNSIRNITWAYPAGVFKLMFPSSGLCLAVVKSAYDPNMNFPIQASCDANWAVTWWYVNSRSQLINNMATSTSLQTGLCLTSDDDESFYIKRCVFKQPSRNRFLMNWIESK